jgi:prolyl-tRNA synthetase
MQLSKGFWQTYKEDPSDAEIASHKLMLRAGLIFKSSSGLYSQLPMGLRSVKKFENIVREEHDKQNCFELEMPVVTSGELWKETARWDDFGDLMLRFKDRGDRDLCISPTNEESITDIFRRTVKSYKELPVTLYQINTKFRDEIRPRFGLMRCREFSMKDAYSFHMDHDCLDKTYEVLYKVYENIFKRAGLDFMVVEADGGAMASSKSKTHEFQVLANSGEDVIIFASDSGYAANVEKALTTKNYKNTKDSSIKIEKISTPNKSTIKDVCEFLKEEEAASLKSMIYKGINEDDSESFYLILISGDDLINDVKLNISVKLKNNLKHLLPANDSDLMKLNLVKGFIGPYSINEQQYKKINLIFDSEVNLEAPYVTGANEQDFHYKNFVAKRDLENIKYSQENLRLSQEGDLCPQGTKVSIKKGIEVGHIFQLGDKYSKGMGATVLDNNGKAINPLMGCYGIGVTRTIAAAIEQSHDKDGIVWPVSLAPYHVHIVLIGKSEEFKTIGHEIYLNLKQHGVEVLYDDRKMGPGFKFKDADLLGLPIRITLGERDYKNDQKFSLRIRKSGEEERISEKEILERINFWLEKLKNN